MHANSKYSTLFNCIIKDESTDPGKDQAGHQSENPLREKGSDREYFPVMDFVYNLAKADIERKAPCNNPH
jgi:hypothetical protein